MKITESDILRHRKEGAWRKLAGIASTIVADAENTATSSLHAVLGGGTRVMLALNHRISNDVDLFIRDPQWIGYLSPRLNSNVESLTSAYEETAVSLKLRFAEGEIDFIVAAPLLQLPEESSLETSFPLEPLAEVLAKKLFHRGWQLAPRDLFDWWAIETNVPSVVPKSKLGPLLKTKFDGISNALDAMRQSPRAANLWDSVQAPNRPRLEDVLKWAVVQLAEYRKLA
ncbi:MAG: nucleotidyl transferase AbiEii/AbiGii toxin family protein [Steroidobacteraceae bacterium]